MDPVSDLSRFKPIADTVECELIYGTDPVEIAEICNTRHPDFLVGFLSRCGFNDVALDLYRAYNKETTS